MKNTRRLNKAIKKLDSKKEEINARFLRKTERLWNIEHWVKVFIGKILSRTSEKLLETKTKKLAKNTKELAKISKKLFYETKRNKAELETLNSSKVLLKTTFKDVVAE